LLFTELIYLEGPIRQSNYHLIFTSRSSASGARRIPKRVVDFFIQIGMLSHMKMIRKEYHQVWTMGEWEISYDVRHRCFDVSFGVIHKYCVNSLQSAVEFILREQKWTLALAVVSANMAEQMQEQMNLLPIEDYK
jgi:hypothetical protein